MKVPVIVNYFVSLFMLCSPLTAIPAFLSVTQGRGRDERRRVGLWLGISVSIILVIATWIGGPFLSVLGIRIPAFQCAGGIVVFLLGLSMLYAQPSPIREGDEHTKAEIPIVPLAIPMMAGPGALSGVILASNIYSSLGDRVVLSICGVLVGAFTALIFYFAAQLEKKLGVSGLNVITRIGGLILASLAVELFAQGVEGLFMAT